MKNTSFLSILLPLFFIICIASCSEVKKGESAVSIVDKISMQKDSFALPAEEHPLSRNNDGVFDDFFYNFVVDEDFRLKRIHFPLPNVHFGQCTAIKQNEWKNAAPIDECNIYAILYSSHSDFGAEKDTTIREVEVDIIHLKNDRIQQLFFECQDNKWMLCKMRTMITRAHTNNNFFDFYRDFANDTTFQQQHIKNPFHFKTEDEYSNESIEGSVNAEAWTEYSPELPKDILVCINYGKKNHTSNERFLILSDLSAGLSTTLRFKKMRNSWMLTNLENY